MSVVVTGGTAGVDYTTSIIGNIETITFLSSLISYNVRFPKPSTVEYTVVGGGGGGGWGELFMAYPLTAKEVEGVVAAKF